MIDRRLKVRHMQAFVEIARQRSLKDAAEILNLTQPAISKTLKELEEIVGATLLTRSRSGVATTLEGDVFLRHATAGLSSFDRALSSISDFAEGARGIVRIGALPSVAARLLPQVVQEFGHLAPGATAVVEDGPHSYLVDKLRAGQIDLVIGRLGKPDTMRGLTFTQLYIESVAIVCAPDHPVQDVRRLSDIFDYPVIYPPEDSAIGPLVDRMMISEGINKDESRVHSVSATFGRGLVLSSHAVWIISTGVVADDISAGRLRALTFDTGLTVGPIGLMARADVDLSPLADLFAQTALRASEEKPT